MSFLAIRIFEIAAVEKYHFDGHHCSFRCSVQDCNTVFQQPEEYTTHAIDTGHDKMHPLPESFKNLFAKNDKQRELLKEDLSKRRKHILEQCGSEGSSQRQAAMKEIMHQLENNALLSAQGKPASEHKWWDIIDGFLYPRDG